MTRVKVKMNSRGAREILRSQEVATELQRRGRRVAAAAGQGHEVDTSIGSTRARVSVRTVTDKARRREATDKTLTRAIDAAR